WLIDISDRYGKVYFLPLVVELYCGCAPKVQYYLLKSYRSRRPPVVPCLHCIYGIYGIRGKFYSECSQGKWKRCSARRCKNLANSLSPAEKKLLLGDDRFFTLHESFVPCNYFVYNCTVLQLP